MKNIHIITGGSSGIGFECAKKFTDGIVLITSRGEESLVKAAEELKEIGLDVAYKTSDLTDVDSLKELFEYAQELGNIKTILNSAGVSGIGGNTKLTFTIDLLGVAHLIDVAKEYLEESGVLILIASMMGYTVPDSDNYNDLLQNPLQAGALDKLINLVDDNSDLAYNYAKKGVQLQVKKNAMEYGKRGLRIVSVSPGIIMSPMTKAAADEHADQMTYMKEVTPAGRNGEPEDIAKAVRFLASENAEFITGTDLLVDGGLTINLPEIMKKFEQKG